MKAPSIRPVRCAIYTRVSTEYGLDQEFNSLDAQYDAASAYIKSQAHAGWTLIRSRYDDGGYSGGSTDRPDLLPQRQSWSASASLISSFAGLWIAVEQGFGRHDHAVRTVAALSGLLFDERLLQGMRPLQRT
jgi:hypothetical protein